MKILRFKFFNLKNKNYCFHIFLFFCTLLGEICNWKPVRNKFIITKYCQFIVNFCISNKMSVFWSKMSADIVVNIIYSYIVPVIPTPWYFFLPTLNLLQFWNNEIWWNWLCWCQLEPRLYLLHSTAAVPHISPTMSYWQNVPRQTVLCPHPERCCSVLTGKPKSLEFEQWPRNPRPYFNDIWWFLREIINNGFPTSSR